MGNEPRLGSKVFYKIGEVSQIAEATGLCVAVLGVRIQVSQAEEKSWESATLCPDEKLIRCWRSSGCSMKKGIRWLV